jgi:hypothetical protein
VTASGWLPDQTPVYQWYIDEKPVPGATGPVLMVPTANGSGLKAIRVTVAAGDVSKTSDTVNVNVKRIAPPTIQFSVSLTVIAYGEKAPLTATATASECALPAVIAYTASEGAVAGNLFDSSGMQFDMTNRAKLQSRVVQLSATATDRIGQTAVAPGSITVILRAEASRRDIVFANRSSRVNNAGKRYLIEELTPQLHADANSTVTLIGHRDTSETDRALADLDTQRVLNTAAVLSAGTGVCPALDLSRVQAKSAGTDQTDPPLPFGDASVKERAGESATDQRAQFRRVEVWFVPGGAEVPPGLRNLQPVSVTDVRAKGCPR